MDFDELVVKVLDWLRTATTPAVSLTVTVFALLQEAEFFKHSGVADSLGVRVGLPLLRSELSRTLLRRVANDLPKIIAKLDDVIEKVVATHVVLR